ncbi:MAG: hypothetical protein KDK39_16860 [Leptospiraceae bacterium]|nr:hypothetical protein [Leptospiraceae bacterium]
MRVQTLSRIIVLIASLLVFYYLSGCNKGEVMEKIGNSSITTDDFESYYEAEVEKISRIYSTDKKYLYQLICDPRTGAIERFKPELVWEKYRDSRMILEVADDDKFLDNPRIQKIIENARNEAIAQLYVNEKFIEKVKISEEDKEKKCEELRAQDPARFGPLTLDDCKNQAFMALKGQYYKQYAGKIQDEIKERVQVAPNKDFDIDKYLKDGVQLYNTIRKEGGCEAPAGNTTTK